MTLVPQNDIDAAAARLRAVYESREGCLPLHNEFPATDVDTAYRIQSANTDYWLAQGKRLVGRKIGLTAKAVQSQMGIYQPDYGMLFADMACSDGEEIPISRLIQPRLEGEIIFVLGRDLSHEQLTMIDVLGAIDYTVAAFEIVDSRIANWKIQVLDTIADNASTGLYIVGTEIRKLENVDLRNCSMVIEHSGMPVSVGTGSACFVYPLPATLWLAKKMVEVGKPLRAGDTILSGALGPVIPVQAGGTYRLSISGIGSLQTSFAAS